MVDTSEAYWHSGANMKPDTCVFCRQAPAVSREHIYRKTYRRYAGADTYSRIEYKDGVSTITPLSPGESPFNQKVQVVCGDCNSRWMNDLDKRVEPAAVAFFEGKPYSCDQAMAADLALWAAKTTMMRVFKDSDRGVRDEQMAYLHDNQEVPPGWLVFLGHTSLVGSLNESRMAFTSAHDLDPERVTILSSGLAVPKFEFAYSQQHSVAIQQMVLITFALSGPEPKPGKVGWPVVMSELIGHLRSQTPAPVLQLWPSPTAFEWPAALPTHPIEDFFPLLAALPIIGDELPGPERSKSSGQTIFKS